MVRGKAAQPGDTRVSKNGYHYTRLEKDWKFTHHIIAEKTLGRKLRIDERVIFKDRDKTNLSPDNIIVMKKGSGTEQRRRAHLESRIQELVAELEELNS